MRCSGSSWDETLPGTLDAAIDADPDRRHNAVIVDEGQDFEVGWLESLGLLLHDQADGVLWIFHDPAQALYRADVVASLDLPRMELYEDHRNHPSVVALAARFRPDAEEASGAHGGPVQLAADSAPSSTRRGASTLSRSHRSGTCRG